MDKRFVFGDREPGLIPKSSAAAVNQHASLVWPPVYISLETISILTNSPLNMLSGAPISPAVAEACPPPPVIEQRLFFCQFFKPPELEAVRLLCWKPMNAQFSLKISHFLRFFLQAFHTHFAFEQASKDVIWSVATSILAAINFFRVCF